ncbi:aminotransferase class I/II-fold pyridoxal phosphate-dependent enzyme [Streptomyces luteolifulvus]|nr:aminotransferase class I/II-fold pyridoxal phosphate-dependent enzyme [Streptomyces luteolifulvus]
MPLKPALTWSRWTPNGSNGGVQCGRRGRARWVGAQRVAGSATPPDDLASVPARAVVLLDEAYIKFVRHSEHPDTLNWIHEYPHLVVLRTFSKAYGLAALRVGYGITSPELAERHCNSGCWSQSCQCATR